jgi:hypothetical protein
VSQRGVTTVAAKGVSSDHGAVSIMCNECSYAVRSERCTRASNLCRW